MLQKLHKNAKTNYAIRLAIKQSPEPISRLANKYHLSWQTVKKWKKRETVEVKLRQLDYQTPAGYLKERSNYSIQRIVI